MRATTISAVITACLLSTACENMTNQQQRALSGGGIGAAGGAVLGALTGGSPLTGALVGGAGGAAIGALTGPSAKSKK